MTQRDHGLSNRDFWAQPAVVCGSAALGAATGAFVGAVVGDSVAKAFFSVFSGDEPPIRVRHGSILVELLDTKQTRLFDPDTDDKWKIVGTPNPLRKKDDYDVLLVSKDIVPAVLYSGKDVDVCYSDGQTVSLKSLNQKTTIKPKSKLTRTSDRELKYGTNSVGHIDLIKLDNKTIYKNANSVADETLQLFLFDF